MIEKSVEFYRGLMTDQNIFIKIKRILQSTNFSQSTDWS